MMSCAQCPRRCHAARYDERGEGFCGMGTLPRIARAAPHYGEEPCISGQDGTGAVFFSGCVLGCVFCQNERVSHGGFGKTVTPIRLQEIVEGLAEECQSVSLVTPTHYAHLLPELLAKPLHVPVVYNTGGYDSVETLKTLEGKIDIYMPDLKYRSSRLSERYSTTPDYFDVAAAAIREMVRQVGPCKMGTDGILRRGVLIRHLVLPGCTADSLAVLRWIRDNLTGVMVSVMAQYTPLPGVRATPLNRRLTRVEYDRVTAFLTDNDMVDGYIQDLEASGVDAIPDFDALEGV